MSESVQIKFSDREYAALLRLARADVRSVPWELKYLLLKELRDRGLTDAAGHIIQKEARTIEPT